MTEAALLRQIAAIDHSVVVVKLRRNFGQTSALAAGFAHARGKYVIAMDGDHQHDPADIPTFLGKLAEGYDVVSGWRKRRIDNFWLRRLPSLCANRLMAALSGVNIHDFGTTFKAYRREILEQIPLYGEMHRFIPALASACGAAICEVPIQHVNRIHGESHYGLSRTFRVFFDLITIRFLLRYRSRPLQFFGRLGVLHTMAGFGVALWLLLEKFGYGVNIVQAHGPRYGFRSRPHSGRFSAPRLGFVGRLAGLALQQGFREAFLFDRRGIYWSKLDPTLMQVTNLRGAPSSHGLLFHLESFLVQNCARMFATSQAYPSGSYTKGVRMAGQPLHRGNSAKIREIQKGYKQLAIYSHAIGDNRDFATSHLKNNCASWPQRSPCESQPTDPPPTSSECRT